jgi:hypothetical protein
MENKISECVKSFEEKFMRKIEEKIDGKIEDAEKKILLGVEKNLDKFYCKFDKIDN